MSEERDQIEKEPGQCPFCMSSSTYVEAAYSDFYVWCTDCDAQGPRHEDPNKAVELWEQA